MEEKYMKLGEVGKGGNGNTVSLVKNLNDNKIYAMKKIVIDESNKEMNERNENEVSLNLNFRLKSSKH